MYLLFVNMNADNNYTPKHFGEKLRQLRKAHRITMLDLAQEFGYTSHGYISEIENGRKQPTIELVLKVARFFGVSTDVLIKDELELDLDTKGDS